MRSDPRQLRQWRLHRTPSVVADSPHLAGVPVPLPCPAVSIRPVALLERWPSGGAPSPPSAFVEFTDPSRRTEGTKMITWNSRPALRTAALAGFGAAVLLAAGTAAAAPQVRDRGARRYRRGLQLRGRCGGRRPQGHGRRGTCCIVGKPRQDVPRSNDRPTVLRRVRLGTRPIYRTAGSGCSTAVPPDGWPRPLAPLVRTPPGTVRRDCTTGRCPGPPGWARLAGRQSRPLARRCPGPLAGAAARDRWARLLAETAS